MSASDEEYVAGDVNTVSGAAAEVDVNAIDEEDLDDEEFDDDEDYEDEDDEGNLVGSAGAAVDDMMGNRSDASTPTAVLNYIARALAEEPDAVVVQTERRQGGIHLRLHVAPDDMGRVIGRRGRTAQAIRTLVGVAGARDGVQASVDIVDD
ncbi:MAG TPA: KH domain-containing protein [Acidimicrobiales bacterium]|nr:KH domain-containing protein [Acidimicrobiales bacterium]